MLYVNHVCVRLDAPTEVPAFISVGCDEVLTGKVTTISEELLLTSDSSCPIRAAVPEKIGVFYRQGQLG
jgi:hypothetical protein